MVKRDTKTKVRLIGFDAAGIAKARELGRIEHRTDAKRMKYDSDADQVTIWLNNGAIVTVPRRMLDDGFRVLKKEVVSTLHVSRWGTALENNTLDIHVSVRGLMRTAVLGDDPYARAGRTKSPAKSAAARANGAKGGRPRAAALESRRKEVLAARAGSRGE